MRDLSCSTRSSSFFCLPTFFSFFSCRRYLHELPLSSSDAASLLSAAGPSSNLVWLSAHRQEAKPHLAGSLRDISRTLYNLLSSSSSPPDPLSITGLAQQFLLVLASQQSLSAKLTLKRLSGLMSKPVSPGLPSPGAQTQAHSHVRLASVCHAAGCPPHWTPPGQLGPNHAQTSYRERVGEEVHESFISNASRAVMFKPVHHVGKLDKTRRRPGLPPLRGSSGPFYIKIN